MPDFSVSVADAGYDVLRIWFYDLWTGDQTFLIGANVLVPLLWNMDMNYMLMLEDNAGDVDSKATGNEDYKVSTDYNIMKLDSYWISVNIFSIQYILCRRVVDQSKWSEMQHVPLQSNGLLL